MIKLIKRLWALLTPSSERPQQAPIVGTTAPSWTPEVVVHPQYWVESNFTLIAKLPPVVLKVVEGALKEGFIKDIAREMAQDSIDLIKETLTIQLHENINTLEGVWTVAGKEGVISMSVKMLREDKWAQAVTAWANTKATITTQGIQLHAVKEEWDRVNLTGVVQIPVHKLQLSLDSTLLWNVLYRNKKNTILWQNKLWVPK